MNINKDIHCSLLRRKKIKLIDHEYGKKQRSCTIRLVDHHGVERKI